MKRWQVVGWLSAAVVAVWLGSGPVQAGAWVDWAPGQGFVVSQAQGPSSVLLVTDDDQAGVAELVRALNLLELRTQERVAAALRERAERGQVPTIPDVEHFLVLFRDRDGEQIRLELQNRLGEQEMLRLRLELHDLADDSSGEAGQQGEQGQYGEEERAQYQEEEHERIRSEHRDRGDSGSGSRDEGSDGGQAGNDGGKGGSGGGKGGGDD